MNIFVLHQNPVMAARYQCDKHVVKMVLESAQMLSTCVRSLSADAPQDIYKSAHFNHPCSVWVRTSKENFLWLYEHAKALAEQYTLRYGKKHKSESVIDLCYSYSDKLIFPTSGLTEFAMAMPDQYKSNDVVRSYRDYYINEKARFAVWSKTEKPPWFP